MPRKPLPRESNRRDFGRMPAIMGVPEAAWWLGVSESTMRRYITEEGLPAMQVSSGPRKVYKLDKETLLAWKDRIMVNKPLPEPAQAAPPVQVIELSAETKQLFERLITALERMNT